ncbi:thioesterase family protein, partial [Salipiger sp. HF18]|uniref:thioesterase family protein n=1 Tax=Salipiger sp. HF18 TaxID=2721557 RepID=UPI0026DC5F66
MVGADDAYVASGKSFFTVDTRIRHLDEVHRGAVLTSTTQMLEGAGKKMKLFHRILQEDGSLAATIETLML